MSGPTPEERIKDLAKLEQDWDSYGAKPIRPEAISAALELLSITRKLGIPDPWPYPTSGGGIYLEWDDEGTEYIAFDAERSVALIRAAVEQARAEEREAVLRVVCPWCGEGIAAEFIEKHGSWYHRGVSGLEDGLVQCRVARWLNHLRRQRAEAAGETAADPRRGEGVETK